MVWLGQDEKPDWHSYIILLSHLGYLFCTWVSYTQGLSILSLNFAFATCISILYHLCDESIVCAGMGIDGWHFLDVFYTFYTVMNMAFFLCDTKPNSKMVMLINGYTVCIAGLIYSARFTVSANVILWALPCMYFGYHLLTGRVHHFNPLKLTIVTVLLLIAVFSFILGNYTGWNQLKRHANAPDSDFYWLFHSGWHFFSQMAIGLLIYGNRKEKEL